MTCSTMLLAFFMLIIVLVAKILLLFNQKVSEKTNDENGKQELVNNKLKSQLSFIFSFAVISDTKFVGIFIFLLSNLFTGIVNLSINTLNISEQLAFLILSIYMCSCFLFPILFYFYNFQNS